MDIERGIRCLAGRLGGDHRVGLLFCFGLSALFRGLLFLHRDIILRLLCQLVHEVRKDVKELAPLGRYLDLVCLGRGRAGLLLSLLLLRLGLALLGPGRLLPLSLLSLLELLLYTLGSALGLVTGSV